MLIFRLQKPSNKISLWKVIKFYYPKILSKYYGDKRWLCRETYESIARRDETCEKPTQEKMNELYELLLVDEMRGKRNELLQQSDFRVVVDYDYPNKNEWILYRQQLRDFPSVWAKNMEFPSPPN